MRVSVRGDDACARAMRSDLMRMGLVVTDYMPAFTVFVDELGMEGHLEPIVDGVDCELERRIVFHLGEAWPAGVILMRAGGNRRDDELHIRVAPQEEMRHAVEVAVRRGLADLAQTRKAWWNR